MNKIIEQNINQSIFDRENWKEALNGMTEFCDSFHTHIVVFDKSGQLVDAFISTLQQHRDPSTDGGIEEYLKHKDKDIRIPTALSKLGIGDSINHHDLFSNNELRNSAIYKEYLSKHNAEHQVLSRLYGPNDSIVLMAVIRGESSGLYADGELNKIRQLMPLIQNTLHSQFKLEEYQLYQQSIKSLLDQQKLGVIYLDNQSEIIQTSSISQQILNNKDGLIDRFKKLSAINKTDNSRLQKLLSTNFYELHFNSIYIRRKNSETPYKITISPIINSSTNFTGKVPTTMLLVSEPSAPSNFPTQIFKDHYQLTKAEIELASAIFNDISLKDYAESKEIKISTVRWTLENISSKTNTKGQKGIKSLALIFS